MHHRAARAINILGKGVAGRLLRAHHRLGVDPDAGAEQGIGDHRAPPGFFPAQQGGKNTAIDQQPGDHVSIAAGRANREGAFLHPIHPGAHP